MRPTRRLRRFASAAWWALLLGSLGPPACRAEGGRTVVSLTFDDGTADHSLGSQILAQRGLRGTFFVNSAQIGTSGYYLTLSQLRAIAAGGHEIGGHTLHHLDLVTLSPAERTRQICSDRDKLVEWGFAPSSFAYPFGSYDAAAQRTVLECGYASARTVGGLSCPNCRRAETLPPGDAFAIRTPDSVKETTTLEDLQRLVEDAERVGGWLVLVFHKVCAGCADNAVAPKTLEAFADWLAPRAAHGAAVKTVGEVMGGAVPGPAVERLEPPGAAAGSGAITLRVFGGPFSGFSRVLWNGRTRVTAFAGPDELRAAIPASDLAAPGEALVSVMTPGAGTSASVRFSIHPQASPDKSTHPIESCRAYPNPWRGDAHRGLPIIFGGLAAGTEVRLLSLSGRPVRTLSVQGGKAVWDLTDSFGSRVGSGYFFFMTVDAGGRRTIGRFLIMK